jgi:hypothetical protein
MKTAAPIFAAGVLLWLAAPVVAQEIGTAGQDALERARSGTVVQWRNPDDGIGGTFVPKPAFQDSSGRICREFNQTVMIGNRQQEAWGTACRQSDGSWKLQRADVADVPQVRYAAPAPVYVPAPVYAPPPRVIYYPQPYYYPRPYYGSSIHIGIGSRYRHHRHRHHRHW